MSRNTVHAEGLVALQSLLQSVIAMTQHMQCVLARDLAPPTGERPAYEEAEEADTKASTGQAEPSDISQAPSPCAPVQVRWYAVIVGRAPGVYDDGKAVTKNIEGVNSNIVHKAQSREDAVEIFNGALRRGDVTRVTVTREILNADESNLL